eukprot:6482062-Prymnesium_polylepis.1
MPTQKPQTIECAATAAARPPANVQSESHNLDTLGTIHRHSGRSPAANASAARVRLTCAR